MPADGAARLDDLERRLARLEAERDVASLMYRYIHACDEVKDAALIASCFTADAVWEGQGYFAEFGETVGTEAIHAMFVDNPVMLPFTAHYLTNPVIEVSPDGEHATGRWHTLEAATLRDRSMQVWMLAWYENDFRRVDTEWKIAHLRYRDRVVCPYEDGWLATRYVSPQTLARVEHDL